MPDGLFDGREFSGEDNSRSQWSSRDSEREPRRARPTDLEKRRELARLRAMTVGFEPVDRCYACDAPAVGFRDRRPEGGQLERACVRHAEARK